MLADLVMGILAGSVRLCLELVAELSFDVVWEGCCWALGRVARRVGSVQGD